MAHSTKCEEKKALLAYCEKHGEKAVAEIKAAIEEREKQASHTRQQLESAAGSFERYHKAQMIIRKQQHEEAQLKFTQQCGAEQKELLMTKAMDMLKVLKIKQMTAAADIARKEKAR